MKKSIIIIILLVSVTALFACSNVDKPPKLIEENAKAFIDKFVSDKEDSKGLWQEFKIVDSKITKLDKTVVFDNILDSPIEVWNLEYRLKIDDISKYVTENGMQLRGEKLIEEDGWLTEDNIFAKQYLVFIIDGNNTRIISSIQPEEFDQDRLSKQEIRVRSILADMGFLSNGAYEGNHIIIKIPLSEDGNIELFLSQPVIQGDKGIWAVERWKDVQGYIHHEFPGIDGRHTDIGIDERYEELQKQFSDGEDLSLGDPVEVAMSFINSTLRQIYLQKIPVEVIVLEIINPATMEDFDDTPVSTGSELDSRIIEINGGFLDLTDEEIDIYEDYIIDFDDNKLKGSSPINIMKIYLHASKKGNYEAEWELYIKNEDDMGWDKEYHMGIPGNEKMGDYAMFENPTNIRIEYKNDNKYATVIWEDKYLQEKDSQGNSIIFGFGLESDEEGIWKVSFMPIQ